jgi:peptide/nickel transport system substrate-binding protein
MHLVEGFSAMSTSVSFKRFAVVISTVVAAGLLAAACGSDSSDDKGSSGGGGKEGGTIQVVMGTAPDYLDPHQAYTTQAAESHWVVYTPLLTYKHANGEEGGELIPGLAKDLPKVSDDGLTYELTLREGLKYSDGTAVKASDFPASVERMMKLNWGGKAFVTQYAAVEGAADFDSGKADSISGITADDATGKITIKLGKPYGAFANVLAFPSLALVPASTPKKNLSANPPVGVGPYKITNVQSNRGWTLEKVPGFAKLDIPGIPTGHLDTINIKIVSNTQTEAQQVLDNKADVFDPGDTLPPALLPQINRDAKDRFAKQTIPSTFYMFLNTQMAPFNNAKAREAVNVGVDRRAFERLASGFLKPECNFLPEGIVGHDAGDCVFGSRDKAPDLDKARRLLEEAGLVGAPVTVWGQQRQPRKEYVDFYTSELNKIGFKATEKIIADETYFPTIGNAKTKAQTGFADWIQDFPNPADFYLLLDADSIQPTNNQNFGNVDDDHIQSELAELYKQPASELGDVEDRWKELDKYQAEQAYTYVYGSEQVPQFFSDRIDFDSAIFHPTYLNDFTSLKLK